MTTKKDELDSLPDDPPMGRGGASASSSGDLGRIAPPPDDGSLVEWTGPLPTNKRKKKEDREAGPSEKHIYVPPVTLPPTKGPADPNQQQKILVAPSVLRPADNSRNQPTIRKLPSAIGPEMLPGAAQAVNGPISDVAVQTLKTGAQPASVQARAAQASPATPAAPATPQQSAKPASSKTAPGGSPWAKGGMSAVDREALPSAQLLSKTGSSTALPMPAKSDPQRPWTGVFVGLLVAAAAAVGVWFLVAWPDPTAGQGTSPPIQVPPNQTPPSIPTLPIPSQAGLEPAPTPSTAVASAEPVPSAQQPATPPEDTAGSAPPPPTPPSPPPASTPAPPTAIAPEVPTATAARPPVTSRPPTTTPKPPSTPTAKDPAPPPPPTPTPPPSTTAPPRPF
ncbi:hypothetical protein [Chondromyces apiculatus]|uniref:Uncharacterized protein n=1 Tax=Chondromyces apiculatus DSM 436 TaxID=1192034 RepID=A0A017SZB7_9BACT|nr:hypothetical protein [Chondromyces apiculatus]EYF02082.1 Hypothetical protein CAP_7422 [Chondromyces apiculatus DSM 436]